MCVAKSGMEIHVVDGSKEKTWEMVYIVGGTPSQGALKVKV